MTTLWPSGPGAFLWCLVCLSWLPFLAMLSSALEDSSFDVGRATSSDVRDNKGIIHSLSSSARCDQSNRALCPGRRRRNREKRRRLPTRDSYLLDENEVSFFAESDTARHRHRDREIAGAEAAPWHATPRVMVGIMTMVDEAPGRQIVRQTWAAPERLPDGMVVRFFMCERSAVDNTTTPLPAADIAAGDMLVLPCRENMNEGKMLAYWTHAAAPGGPIDALGLDFICKGDMDTFVLASELMEEAATLPRRGVVGGARKVTPVAPHRQSKVPAFATHISYMAGQFELLSADLVRWIAGSETAARFASGPEDVMLGYWLHAGRFPHRGRLTYDWGHLDPCRPWVHREMFPSEEAAATYLGIDIGDKKAAAAGTLKANDAALLKEAVEIYTDVRRYSQLINFLDRTAARRREFCDAAYH